MRGPPRYKRTAGIAGPARIRLAGASITYSATFTGSFPFTHVEAGNAGQGATLRTRVGTGLQKNGSRSPHHLFLASFDQTYQTMPAGRELNAEQFDEAGQ